MMRFSAALCLAALMGISLSTGRVAHAAGLFGGSTTLDPSFCRTHNLRQTVIYVDDSILVQGQIDWARTLYAKLKATLVPGERTTLVQLSPASGQSSEIWTGCWPSYSEEQTEKLAHQTSFFSGDPLAGLKDQQGFFFRDFGVAAAKIMKGAARPAAEVTVNASSPPKKSIIRALASDGARYAHAHETIRVILYSDLAENSDLGSVFAAPLPNEDELGTRLGTYLRRSVFYVYGTASDVHGDSSVQDNIRKFWTSALQSMAANIGGIGSDLNIPNAVPVSSYSYDVSLTDDGSELHGHMSLLTDRDNGLVDSWLGITRLRNGALNGTLHCTSPESCTLDAQTNGGIVTTSPSETIAMKSDGSKELSGSIGVPGSSVNLKMEAEPSSD